MAKTNTRYPDSRFTTPPDRILYRCANLNRCSAQPRKVGHFETSYRVVVICGAHQISKRLWTVAVPSGIMISARVNKASFGKIAGLVPSRQVRCNAEAAKVCRRDRVCADGDMSPSGSVMRLSMAAQRRADLRCTTCVCLFHLLSCSCLMW